ncbi:MAG TPA: hypothetical protein VHN37_11885 [Actinomycetota bacterium]|nr:hypothetical protein [Actinomycetota bacterium]
MAAAVLVAVSVALPAPALEAASGPKTLAGTTSIKGSRTGALAVRLPRAASVQVRSPGGTPDGSPAPGIAIDGRGRLAGFYLTSPDVTDVRRPYLAAFQFRFCPEGGCRPADRAYEYVYSSAYDAATGGEHEHPGAVELPAGDYLLYLVSDGAPVDVRIRLKGLGGKTTLRPAASVTSGFSVPTEESATSIAGGKAFWYGHEASFSGQGGMYVGAMRLDVEDWSYLRVGLCISEGAAAPPQVRDAPYCPVGQGAAEERTEVVPVDRAFVKPWIGFVGAPGDFAFGQHYTGVFSEADVDSISFHVDVDPASIR